MSFNSYLDFGGALAAFGLIFAVYQLRTPKWDIVLRIRRRWQSNLFQLFLILGLILTLIKVLLLEDIIGCLPSPFSSPLFYEIAAYASFILSPLSLVYFSTNSRGIYNSKTATSFYEVMSQEISKASEGNVTASLEVLLNNFESICHAITSQDSEDDYRMVSRSIFDVVLSDESMVEILTTKRLDALSFIFSVLEDSDISDQHVQVAVPKIIQNLFEDQESFFYRHLEGNGLALSSNIFFIFDSPKLITKFNLFNLKYSAIKEIDSPPSVDVFIEAFSRTIVTYYKTGRVSPRFINNGFSVLSDLFGSITTKICAEEKRGMDTKHVMKSEWMSLYHISHFFGHDYLFLGHGQEINSEILEREENGNIADFNSDISISEGLAAAIYKAFEQLSYVKNTIDVYHITQNLLHGMTSEAGQRSGYVAPFERRMWEQIAKNVLSKHYPASLRIYLEPIGFSLAADNLQRRPWLENQVERMKRLLYIDLKPLIESNVKMVNKAKMEDALLPSSMSYRNGRFTYRFGFGSGEEKEIQPPAVDSQSALLGVDLESIPFL